MPPTIKAHFRWTEDEFLKAYKHHYQCQLRRPFRWAINAIAILLVLLAVFVLVVIKSSIGAAAMLFVALYWLCLRGSLTRWFLRRKFRRRPDQGHEVIWIFTEDDLRSESDDVVCTLKWKAFIKWSETPEGFLMYQLEDLFNWLPFDAFDSKDDIDALRDFVRDKVPTFKQFA